MTEEQLVARGMALARELAIIRARLQALARKRHAVQRREKRKESMRRSRALRAAIDDKVERALAAAAPTRARG